VIGLHRVIRHAVGCEVVQLGGVSIKRVIRRKVWLHDRDYLYKAGKSGGWVRV